MLRLLKSERTLAAMMPASFIKCRNVFPFVLWVNDCIDHRNIRYKCYNYRINRRLIYKRVEHCKGQHAADAMRQRDANSQFSEAHKFISGSKFWKLWTPEQSKCTIIRWSSRIFWQVKFDLLLEAKNLRKIASRFRRKGYDRATFCSKWKSPVKQRGYPRFKEMWDDFEEME